MIYFDAIAICTSCLISYMFEFLLIDSILLANLVVSYLGGYFTKFKRLKLTNDAKAIDICYTPILCLPYSSFLSEFNTFFLVLACCSRDKAKSAAEIDADVGQLIESEGLPIAGISTHSIPTPAQSPLQVGHMSCHVLS